MYFFNLTHHFSCLLAHAAVHCNLSQNGIDHQMCPEDVTSQLEEEEESVDVGSVLLDDDSPSYQDISPPMYQRHAPPHRSVSESELSRVRVGPKAPFVENESLIQKAWESTSRQCSQLSLQVV